jgi:hypothetical protein
MSNDVFDFGFTAVDESELESVSQAQQVANEQATTASMLEDKVNRLYNAILPLLSNLKKNPEKDYIYWPNRTAKVEQFEDLISNIVKD